MKRIVYQGRLRFPYGFHTGDGRRQGASDQPLYRDHDGHLVLSGESLAGALRADMERLAPAMFGSGEKCDQDPKCSCVVCELMGPRAHRSRSRGARREMLRASRLYVLGGRVEGVSSVDVRDRVGISRKTRTAAPERKFDVEVVNPGVEFPFLLRLDGRVGAPSQGARELLEITLRRMSEGWLFLGGKRSSGLGRAEVAQLERHDVDLREPSALVAQLRDEAPEAGGTATELVSASVERWQDPWEQMLTTAAPSGPSTDDTGSPEATEADDAWGQVRLHLQLQFPWRFLVSDPTRALGEDVHHAFMRLPDGRPLLPGSALRGALRARGEQILRTFGGSGAACDLNAKGKSCHEKIQRENRKRKKQGKAKLPVDEERRRHCLACRVFGSGRLASSVRLTDFLPVEGRRGREVLQEFVAIDRFGGGAAPRLKFTSQAASGVWLDGEVHLEVGGHRLEPWGLGLMALVFRDLLWGDVPVGFGSGKGLNEYSARLVGAERFWTHAPQPLQPLMGAGTPGTMVWKARPEEIVDPSELSQALEEGGIDAVKGWVVALHEEIQRTVASPGRGEGEGAAS